GAPGREGSWRSSLTGTPLPNTRTWPITARTPLPNVAPVHVSRSLPSLPRIRRTVPTTTSETQRSKPSDLTEIGPGVAVVRPRTDSFCVVQNWFRAAARLLRVRTASTDLERNAAICSRVTGLAGSYVVAVVPVVIARVKTSITKGQKASGATSKNGPQVPESLPAAPPRNAAARAAAARIFFRVEEAFLIALELPDLVGENEGDPEAPAVAARSEGPGSGARREGADRRQVRGLPERHAVAVEVRYEDSLPVEGRYRRAVQAVAGQRLKDGPGRRANDRDAERKHRNGGPDVGPVEDRKSREFT